ncbi:MAG: signal recognition particle-docking protein FtsY [Promethearchaeota archaeon]
MLEKLKKGLKKLTQKELTERNLEKKVHDLKITLIKNDVALFAADRIAELTVENLKGERVSRLASAKKRLLEALKGAIFEILETEQTVDLLELAREKKARGEPLVLLFLGVNGTGKTTTIAKVAKLLKDNSFSVVAAASDTFRAGAMEQLGIHMDNVGVRVIRHQYKSDAASVAYDAIEHARAKRVNAVLIDTAGRQVTDKNLMVELQKIIRVNEPDLVVFVGDSLAGNDVLFQAEKFSENVQVDCSIITKLDADAKGGAALSIAYITKKPIIFVGVGQGYDDLERFDPEWFVSKLLDL